MLYRLLVPSLFFPGELTILAQADLEKYQEHGRAKPERDQCKADQLSGQPLDQGRADAADNN
jgi:hypothetical protein